MPRYRGLLLKIPEGENLLETNIVALNKCITVEFPPRIKQIPLVLFEHHGEKLIGVSQYVATVL